MRVPGRLLAVVVAVLAGVLPALAGGDSIAPPRFAADTTLILSGAPSLLAPLPGPVAQVNGRAPSAGIGAVSADGRYVAFTTNAFELGASGDGSTVVVRRDTATGELAIVSRGPDGALLPNATAPSISADGRRVAFTAAAPDFSQHVWVRDLVDGTTTLVDANRVDGGLPDGGVAGAVSISADGNRVAFISAAANLADGDNDSAFDVFVRDLAAHSTILASVVDGTNAKGLGVQEFGSGGPSVAISGDGNHVVFIARAKDLISGDTDATIEAFVRDLAAPGRTRLASVAGDGTGAKADANAIDVAISGDGSRVAFSSSAGDLGTPNPLSVVQVWVHDFADGSTALVSRADGETGAIADGTSNGPILSADGHVVAFLSDAGNLVPGMTVPENYRRNLVAHTTELVSRGQGADGIPAARITNAPPSGITAHGECVTFTAEGGLLGTSTIDQSAYMRLFEPDCGRVTHIPDPPPPTTTPTTTTTPPPPDTTAPVLSAVSLTHARFRVARAATALAAALARGTVLRFTSSEAGRLSIRVERVRRGHAPRRVATLTRGIQAGRGRVAFSGRIGRKPLAAGSYRLTLTARDAAGNVSKPRRLAFTILRG